MTIDEARVAVETATDKASDEAISELYAQAEMMNIDADVIDIAVGARRADLEEAKERLRDLEKGEIIEGAIKGAIMVDLNEIHSLSSIGGDEVMARLKSALSEFEVKMKRIVLGRTRRTSGAGGGAPATASFSEARVVFSQLLGQPNVLDLMRSSKGRTKFLTPLSEWVRRPDGSTRKVSSQYAIAEVNGEEYVYRAAVTVDNLEYLKSLIV